MANCESCKKVQNAPENVPYIVHESSMARMERQIKRLWIALLVVISMLFVSNAVWVIYESQFETLEFSYDHQQDGQGTNIIGNGNGVNNGETAEREG